MDRITACSALNTKYVGVDFGWIEIKLESCFPFKPTYPNAVIPSHGHWHEQNSGNIKSGILNSKQK